jgi:hypothetical protein
LLKDFASLFTYKNKHQNRYNITTAKTETSYSAVGMFSFKLHYVREKHYVMSLMGRITVNPKRKEEKTFLRNEGKKHS